MAVAARKDEYVYAPSRVYSHSRAATAEALPNEMPQQAPRPEEPGSAEAEPRTRTREPAVKTRVQTGPSPRQRRKQRVLPKVASVACIFLIAAVLIGVIVRYSAIALAYSAVNDLEDGIAESERNIAALNVQLNNALNIDAAREAALAAGLGYPTAEQIVRVRETVGNYQKNDGGTDGEPNQNQDASTNPDGGMNTD